MSVSLTLTLNDRVLQRYTRAARRLRRVLGSAAPTTEQLLAHELAERAPRLIVDDYLDDRQRRRL